MSIEAFSQYIGNCAKNLPLQLHLNSTYSKLHSHRVLWFSHCFSSFVQDYLGASGQNLLRPPPCCRGSRGAPDGASGFLGPTPSKGRATSKWRLAPTTMLHQDLTSSKNGPKYLTRFGRARWGNVCTNLEILSGIKLYNAKKCYFRDDLPQR